jgi:hypothetical protein
MGIQCFTSSQSIEKKTIQAKRDCKRAKVLIEEEEESTDEDTPEDNLIKELQELN